MSTLQPLFTSAECDIFYNEELHIIQTRWKGIFVEGERLREIFNKIITAMDVKKASIVVADAREMLIIKDEDQKWTLDSWYPRAVRAGFRQQGLILSKNTFNELTVKKITAQYDDTFITTQYFETPSDALEWVREMRKSDASGKPVKEEFRMPGR